LKKDLVASSRVAGQLPRFAFDLLAARLVAGALATDHRSERTGVTVLDGIGFHHGDVVGADLGIVVASKLADGRVDACMFRRELDRGPLRNRDERNPIGGSQPLEEGGHRSLHDERSPGMNVADVNHEHDETSVSHLKI
jgi:hypothetical protein